jgi:cysteine-rich repeat protein
MQGEARNRGMTETFEHGGAAARRAERSCRSARRGLAVAALVIAAGGGWSAAAAASALVPRHVPAKPERTLLRGSDAADRIALKFSEGTNVRLRGGVLSAPGLDLRAFDARLRAAGVPAAAPRRLFAPRDEAALDAERAEGQRHSGRQLADLNLYYELAVPPGADVAALCDRLNALPYVELAMPMPRPAPAPIDIAPATPDFTALQGYRSAPPFGIGALDPLLVPGGDGSGRTIVDVEYNWVLDHEDLELPPGANIDTATLVDPFPEDEANHGTAVLGELVGGDNGYGITGLVPGATALVAPTFTAEFSYNVGRAVSLATAVLSPGDVILIEQQACVCFNTCNNDTQAGLGPVEFFQPWYDAIATATALGIVVVEAAGNGAVNLDQPTCNGLFDRSVRDSGAFIVGAGAAGTRARLSFSDYGSRVDLQGWGNAVTTTGYGGLFNPEIRQRYVQFFGGTSSASPIVTGAAAALQAVRITAGLPPYTPAELRALLVATGTPQPVQRRTSARCPTSPRRALAQSCGDGTTDAGEDCDDGNTDSGDGCDITCTVTGCGNGVVTGGEECDDGNVVDGDTCPATCVIPQPCADALPLPAAGGTLSGTTGGWSEFSGSCGGGGTGEVVYEWTPDASGLATIETCGDTDFDTVVYVREAPCVSGSELACNDNACGVQSRLEMAVVAGQTYYIFVDGAGSAAGDFTLTVQPPGCPRTPRPSCRTAGRSRLVLSQAGSAKDKLIWKWGRGQATDPTEFDDPRANRFYELCLYAGTAAPLAARMPLPLVAGRWSATPTGYDYSDPSGASDGMTRPS